MTEGTLTIHFDDGDKTYEVELNEIDINYKGEESRLGPGATYQGGYTPNNADGTYSEFISTGIDMKFSGSVLYEKKEEK